MNEVKNCENYIAGNFVAPSSGNYLDVLDPSVPNKVIARCAISAATDVEIAVEAAQKAFPAWSKMTLKARAAIMMKFHSIIQREAEDLAHMIVLENGKNFAEAMGDGKLMSFWDFCSCTDAAFFLTQPSLLLCNLQWPRATKLWNTPVPYHVRTTVYLSMQNAVFVILCANIKFCFFQKWHRGKFFVFPARFLAKTSAVPWVSLRALCHLIFPVRFSISKTENIPSMIRFLTVCAITCSPPSLSYGANVDPTNCIGYGKHSDLQTE